MNSIKRYEKKTLRGKKISNIYEWDITECIRCCKCNNDYNRKDIFLSLLLNIKTELNNSHNQSLEEALSEYIKPEILDKNNQYYCITCQSKQDAIKILKFERLPDILTIKLKGFDYNHKSLKKLKLNNKDVFPLILNANPFINDTKIEDKLMNIQTDIETNNIIKDIETNIANDIKIHIIKDTQDIDFTFNYNEIDNKKMKVLVLKNNEAIFEDLCKIPINKEYIPKEKIIENIVDFAEN